MSSPEEKIIKKINAHMKQERGRVRFQSLSLLMMEVTMDDLFTILKKMKTEGSITFGDENGPTSEVPALPTPALYVYSTNK